MTEQIKKYPIWRLIFPSFYARKKLVEGQLRIVITEDIDKVMRQKPNAVRGQFG